MSDVSISLKLEVKNVMLNADSGYIKGGVREKDEMIQSISIETWMVIVTDFNRHTGDGNM